jgi:hypothetical protein
MLRVDSIVSCLALVLLAGGMTTALNTGNVRAVRTIAPDRLSFGRSTVSTRLNVESDMETRPGMKGYYRRPSRAIEKGGGFFVPGLEGERIRIISSVALIAMLVVNRAGVQVSTTPQVVSELIGLLMAAILFVQGVSDVFVGGTAAAPQPSSFLSVIQSVTGTKYSTTLESLVRTIVQTCENVSYVLVYQKSDSQAKVLMELGPLNVKATASNSLGDIDKALSSALGQPIDGAPISVRFSPSASLKAQLVAAGVSVPADDDNFAAAVDSRGWRWLIASNAPKDEFEKNSKWISSLLAAPL